MANHKLANILYNDKTWGPKYRSRVRSLFGAGKAFDTADIIARIDHLHSLLKPFIHGNAVQSSRQTTGTSADPPTQHPAVFEKAVSALRGWVHHRPGDVLAVVDTAQWAWPSGSSYDLCQGIVFPYLPTWHVFDVAVFDNDPNITGTQHCLECLPCKAKTSSANWEECGYQVTEAQCVAVGREDDQGGSMCTWGGVGSGAGAATNEAPEYTCGLDTTFEFAFGVKVYPNACFARCVGAVTCDQGSSEGDYTKLSTAKKQFRDYDKCTTSLFEKGGSCDLRA
jgi:hypothetical protein